MIFIKVSKIKQFSDEFMSAITVHFIIAEFYAFFKLELVKGT